MFIKLLKSIAGGSVVGVAALTALPVFGGIGVLTATGAVVGSVVGAIAAAVDSLNND